MAPFEMFENRLIKMNRHISKWARRQGISCYRIYDRDIPQFPFVIERFEDCLSVSEYKTSRSLEGADQKVWLEACMEILARVTEISDENIFLRERERQKGSSQYTKQDVSDRTIVANENGLKFKLNMSSYLDTGLFLDHRITRRMVREEAEGKFFLNLFSYTGSFSVYAASAGATTISVDLSRTYTAWCHENLLLNGFPSKLLAEREARPQQWKNDKGHQVVQGDVIDLLDDMPAGIFDLTVVDPPSFSNSKRMEGTFDVQRDHVELLRKVLRVTRPGGVIYFSTNLRTFKMETTAIVGAECKDITRRTIDNDFRNLKVYRARLEKHRV
ncbi:MAG: class I SAM-dependent methyltransferase [Leptospirales bacterium]|nr:class I SAM-dependent methyltransferase [Leptospirales bacterium]